MCPSIFVNRGELALARPFDPCATLLSSHGASPHLCYQKHSHLSFIHSQTNFHGYTPAPVLACYSWVHISNFHFHVVLSQEIICIAPVSSLQLQIMQYFFVLVILMFSPCQAKDIHWKMPIAIEHINQYAYFVIRTEHVPSKLAFIKYHCVFYLCLKYFVWAQN